MRALKILTAVCFVLISLLALARPVGAFSGAGTGESDNPYQITTCLQLQEMNGDLEANYLLANDINCGEGAPTGNDTRVWNEDPDNPGTYLGFEPIGSFELTEFFGGDLDGNNKTISGVYINRPGFYSVGLIDTAGYARISDVTLEDVQMDGGYFVGGLAGAMIYTEVENVSVQGESQIRVAVPLDSGSFPYPPSVGGLAGYFAMSAIQYGFSAATVVSYSESVVGGLVGINEGGYIVFSGMSGIVGSAEGYVGGLVGVNSTDGLIGGSYSAGVVVGSDRYIGGLVAMNISDITDSYSLSQVVVPVMFEGGHAGGLVGYNSDGEIRNSYAVGQVFIQSYEVPEDLENVGGLVGLNQAAISQSFWNTETTGEWEGCGVNSEDCTGAAGKTSAQLRDIATFTTELGVSWDFENIWQMNGTDNSGYPFFFWQDFTSDSGEGLESSSQDLVAAPDNTYRPAECTDQLPGSVPTLFRVDQAGSTATLWIVPGDNPYTGLVIWYGTDGRTDQFAENISVSNAVGMIEHTIEALEPGGAYTFKVQASNGCAHSAMSETLGAQQKSAVLSAVPNFTPTPFSAFAQLRLFNQLRKIFGWQ